jgi:hypothetical protein
VLGLPRKARLQLGDRLPLPQPALVGDPAVAAIPVVTPYGNLTVDVDEHRPWLAGEVARIGLGQMVASAKTLTIPLPMHATAGQAWPARVTLAAGRIPDGPSVTFPGRITRDAGAVLVADITAARGPVGSLRSGEYDVYLHTGVRGLPPVKVGRVPVPATPLRRTIGRRARAAGRRLPLPVRRAVRSAFGPRSS